MLCPFLLLAFLLAPVLRISLSNSSPSSSTNRHPHPLKKMSQHSLYIDGPNWFTFHVRDNFQSLPPSVLMNFRRCFSLPSPKKVLLEPVSSSRSVHLCNVSSDYSHSRNRRWFNQYFHVLVLQISTEVTIQTFIYKAFMNAKLALCYFWRAFCQFLYLTFSRVLNIFIGKNSSWCFTDLNRSVPFLGKPWKRGIFCKFLTQRQL